jgi:hypothetical protein
VESRQPALTDSGRLLVDGSVRADNS